MVQNFYTSLYIAFLAVAKIGNTEIGARRKLGGEKGGKLHVEWLYCLIAILMLMTKKM